MEEFRRKLIYIAGGLTDMTEDKRAIYRDFYTSLGEVGRRFDLDPYIPHIHGDPKLFPDFTPHQIDRIDRLAVTQSYLMIAYVGLPALGVGIEIELAYHSNIPVVILFEVDKLKERRISRLVRGNPAVKKEIAFDNFEDARQKLADFLQVFVKQIKEENLPPPLSL